MPTYDYLCNSCKYQFEKFQPITEKPVRKCPKCGKLQVQRLIGTGGGIIFKGSGFYQTDYRSKNYHEAAKKDKPAKETSCPNKACEKRDKCCSD